MSDESTNEQFRSIAFNTLVEEAEETISAVLALESRSRHEMACNGDHEAAAALAAEAYVVFTELPIRAIPTFVMNLADRHNREHEAYTKALDDISDAREHLRQFRVLRDQSQFALAEASLDAAEKILAESLDNALYEKMP